MGWLASGLYSRTIGSFFTPEVKQPDENQELVCIEFLDRQSDQLLKWAAKMEKQIHSEAQLKRQLRQATQHTEEEIEMLLVHMKHTSRMVVERCGAEDDADLVVCKLASPVNKGQVEELSQKDKAEFSLQTNLKRLEGKILTIRQKLSQCSQEISEALRNKNKQQALMPLKRKKMLEKHLTVLEGQKFTIEELLLQCEAAESTASIFETMSQASEMQKSLMKDTEGYDQLFDDINKQKDDIDSLTSQFASASLKDDDDLLKELEEITSPIVTKDQALDEQRIKDEAELNARLEQWEQENEKRIENEEAEDQISEKNKAKKLMI